MKKIISKPIAPKMPQKQILKNKILLQEEFHINEVYDFKFIFKEVLESIKEDDNKKITLSINIDNDCYEYCSDFFNMNIVENFLEDNPDYDNQMKLYNIDLNSYNEKLNLYNDYLKEKSAERNKNKKKVNASLQEELDKITSKKMSIKDIERAAELIKKIKSNKK